MWSAGMCVCLLAGMEHPALHVELIGQVRARQKERNPSITGTPRQAAAARNSSWLDGNLIHPQCLSSLGNRSRQKGELAIWEMQAEREKERRGI